MKSVKKVYHLNFITNKMEIMDIVEYAKLLIMVVFQKDHFTILILSKKIMQGQSHPNNFIQKPYLFTQNFAHLDLVDQHNASLEHTLESLFKLSLVSDSEIFQQNYECKESIIAVTPFMY